MSMSGTKQGFAGAVIKGLGVVVLIGGASAGWLMWNRPKPRPPATPTTAAAASTINEESSLEEIATALKAHDGMALAVLQKRLTYAPGALMPAIDAGESGAWIEVCRALNESFVRFAPYGRASATAVALRIMERYAVAPAPVNWSECMQPVYQVVSTALNDSDPSVRAAAMKEVGHFWKWSPGRELETTGEVDYIADWKESIYAQVVRALADVDGSVRARAVGALSALPIDLKAAPAAACVNDPNFEVRLYVLAGFANRRELLDEESIVGLLYDPVPAVATSAETVLKQRGLTPEQIGLCKLVVHPLSHMRSSVIPMLQARTDIDPTIWLIFLSRDKDQAVAMKAVEALGQSSDTQARQRLVEMANDPRLSPDLREAAQKLAPAETTTVALPPLPGSPSLNPRAN